jgi:hypothetical protein
MRVINGVMMRVLFFGFERAEVRTDWRPFFRRRTDGKEQQRVVHQPGEVLAKLTMNETPSQVRFEERPEYSLNRAREMNQQDTLMHLNRRP